MGTAKVKISHEYLFDNIPFPVGTIIGAVYNDDDYPETVIVVEVSHPDIPDDKVYDAVPTFETTYAHLKDWGLK